MKFGANLLRRFTTTLRKTIPPYYRFQID